MLILSRKEEQTIQIRDTETNDLIVIKVIQVRHHTASIGVDAPRKYEILRGEILEKKDDN